MSGMNIFMNVFFLLIKTMPHRQDGVTTPLTVAGLVRGGGRGAAIGCGGAGLLLCLQCKGERGEGGG